MKRATYNLPSHAHYLTFSCYRRQQLLTNDVLRRRLLMFWQEARSKALISIWAYVLMPEHVHLLIHPRHEEYAMSRLLRILKEPFTRWLVGHWSARAPHMLERIRVRRGTRLLHRFWQEGGGYDRNLHTWEAIRKAVQYIEWNPVRRNLVTDAFEWEWSSARAREGRTGALLSVDPWESGDVNAGERD